MTAETPMRERIARVIFESMNDVGDLEWDECGKSTCEPYFIIAGAVLDAMREPTKGMIEAAYKAPMLGGFKSQYQCAIDAAKEGK